MAATSHRTFTKEDLMYLFFNQQNVHLIIFDDTQETLVEPGDTIMMSYVKSGIYKKIYIYHENINNQYFFLMGRRTVRFPNLKELIDYALRFFGIFTPNSTYIMINTNTNDLEIWEKIPSGIYTPQPTQITTH